MRLETPTPQPPKAARKTAPKFSADFPVAPVLRKIELAIAPFRKAAMFELADEGYNTVFEQLVACIISVRTFDETTIPAAHALFALARTPFAMSACSVEDIAAAIHKATFARTKAKNILTIAKRTVAEFKGELPCDFKILTSFPGVGPKCAGLALGVACGEAVISVDIHVHRVTNRWGLVATATPEKTLDALTLALPKKHWIDINRLLVPFGKHICTGKLPHCNTCPVNRECAQVGVTTHR
jgi:endonuclease-3